MNESVGKITGIIFIIIGIFGIWEFLADITGWKTLNILTKDQVFLLFGIMLLYHCLKTKKGE